MTLITEADLRNKFKNLSDSQIKGQSLDLTQNAILTPSAKSYILEKGINLVGNHDGSASHMNKAMNADVIFPKEIINQKEFVTLNGSYLDKKPEHMTHLRGNILVLKDNPIIAFRGKIDSLESEILLVQSELVAINMPKLAEDLEQVLNFIRELLAAEVKKEPVKDFTLLGLKADDLRKQSHFPKNYFGLEHFMPDYQMPRPVLLLNKLRSKSRETELFAYAAFKDENGLVKANGTDIITAFNRLSSLFYIMMFWIRTGKYN